jgi:DinB superfamily
MLATVDPQAALRLMQIEHQAVRALITELSAEEMLRPDTIRYGLYADQQLSFKDLLAHLICYEAFALEAIDAWRQGAKHWIGAALASDYESMKVHYAGIADRAQLSLEAVIQQWDETQAALEAFYSDVSIEDWRAAAPYATDEATDLGGMLEAILVTPPRPMYRHLPVHTPDSATYIHQLRG